MDLTTAMHTRRSVRKFTAEMPTKECLEEIVCLANYAPTWKNTQISRFIVLTGEEKNYVARTYFAQLYPNNLKVIESAPVLLIQTFVEKRSGFERDGTFSTAYQDAWQYYDCGIMGYALSLAAHEKGLGSVILGMFDRDGLEKHLKLPENQRLMAAIALGYPDEAPAATKRKTAQELLSFWKEEEE